MNRLIQTTCLGLVMGMMGACSDSVQILPPTAQAQSPQAAQSASLTSPDGQNQFSFRVENGQLRYSVIRGDETLIDNSQMGLRFLEQPGFDENLVLDGIEEQAADTSWEQPWGERRIVRDNHNELLLKLRREDSGARMHVRVKAFNDGIGFRYEVPEQDGFEEVAIMDELTDFNVGRWTTSWWIPSRMYNRYEYLYKQTPVDAIQIVHTPLTLRTESGTHMSLHEAALVDYSAMSLLQTREGVVEADLAPRSDGTKVRTSAPFETPWRTIQISDDAAGLINSDLILNLNAPNKLGDVSWFEPGKYVGIWWDQHVKNRTWGTDGVHAATTDYTIKYMDFAAKYGFSGVLVEGWNIGWDGDWFSNGDVFSFTESYPDFDIEAVAEHGRKVGVPLIGHHETSGNISNYENQLEDALDLYAAHDVEVIKTGYVADAGDVKRIDENGIARYEYHDGQHLVDHHLKVVKRAAEHEIAINAHEPVKDTGLRRTYPNWVSREGARGQEFNAWGVPPNGPDHVPNLLFTRMLSGPMDYTAGAFDLRPSEQPPVTEAMGRHSTDSRIEHTLAKELSLYVAIYSPIQMVIDSPENYEARPEAFQFIVDVPTDWEESIALDGEVGEFAVIARKDRNSEDWYVGALTDEVARRLDFNLSFLGEGAYQAQVYRDGPDADYDTNPYDIVIESYPVTADDNIALKLGRSGGAAIRFKKL